MSSHATASGCGARRSSLVPSLASLAAAGFVIAFAVGGARAAADCGYDIFRIDASGKNRELILRNVGIRGWQILDISPNRKRILAAYGLKLFSASINGSNARQLAEGAIRSAHWSPDGKKIAFDVDGISSQTPPSSRCVYPQVWVVDASAANLTKISDCARTPSWAPDSRRLTFIGNWNNYVSGSLVVADADGENRREIADWSGPNDPRVLWAPRGSLIAFTTGVSSIAVIDADNPGKRPKTVARGSQPTWSPDARRLAFVHVTRAYRRTSLRVVNADGTGFRQMDIGRDISLPTWSSSSQTIAYAKAPILKHPSPLQLQLYILAMHSGRPLLVTHEPSTSGFGAIYWARASGRIIYLRCLS